jgi:hypothetical protein
MPKSEFHEASERLQRYQNQILPKSQKVRESVAFAYEKGGSSLVDLLEAERADNDARLATAQAMSDTASAVADLKAATEAMNLANVRTHENFPNPHSLILAIVARVATAKRKPEPAGDPKVTGEKISFPAVRRNWRRWNWHRPNCARPPAPSFRAGSSGMMT